MPMPPARPAPPRWHLVCRVIDNFGDVGVLWRLARQLHHEHGVQVDFFIDQPECLRLMAPDIRVVGEDDNIPPAAGRSASCLSDAHRRMATACRAAAEGGMRVHRLDEAAPVGTDVDVVVAGFQARLPERARRRLVDRVRADSPVPLLVQLDYLSAEDWIDGTHGLPSLHPDGLREWFFNPGFGPGNGGLLLERELLRERDAILTDPGRQQHWLKAHGIDARPDDWLVSVLCYPDAPLQALIDAWLADDAPPPASSGPDCTADILLPACIPAATGTRDTADAAPAHLRARPRAAGLNDIQRTTGVDMAARACTGRLHLLVPGAGTQTHLGFLPARAEASGGRLAVTTLPFLPQTEFDHLLWCSHLNLVRGEDSWIRALWAGRPWLWQAYRQEEDAHLDKLAAFLTRAQQLLEAGATASDTVADTSDAPGITPTLMRWQAAMRAWNQAPGTDIGSILQWRDDPAALGLALQLAGRVASASADLARRLVVFAATRTTHAP